MEGTKEDVVEVKDIKKVVGPANEEEAWVQEEEKHGGSGVS